MKKRVLVIDDEAIDRRQFARLLASDGPHWVVDTATTATEGLTKFDASPPDCVLLDNSLGPDDGITLLSKVKQRRRFCPVIMVTGLGSDAIALEAMKRGASDYLVKTTLTGASLVTTITNAIERMSLEQRLELQTAAAQRQEDQVKRLEKVVDQLKAMSSAGSSTNITRAITGAGAVRDRAAEVFRRLTMTYEALMDDYLQQLVMDAPKPLREMKSIVRELGQRGAGPRDLLDVHISALEAAEAKLNPSRSEAYSLQGRLMALEMMGLLVDFYRLGGRPTSEWED
jgi:DNA-binding NarL/FixJ family response regulator